MKSLYCLVALLLLAVAIFLGTRGGARTVEGGRGDEAGISGAEASSYIHGEEGDEMGNRKLRSSRGTKSGRATIVTTESGLQYEVLKEGSGERPQPDSTVKLHYVGTLADGTVFDSSRERGEPMKFPLKSVIMGMSEGVQLMQPGAQFVFTIPPELGYGKRGGGGTIPPDATLIFEVELLEIESEEE